MARLRGGRSALRTKAPAEVTEETPRTFAMDAAAPAIPTNSLVASSVRYSGTSARVYAGPQEWQHRAYYHYGICGEARYAANFFANNLSRATLYAATPDAENVFQKQTSGPAYAELHRIFGPETTPSLLAAIGLHLTIAGECYLVGREYTVTDFDPVNGERGAQNGEVWEVVSVMEMQVNGDEWSINYGNGKMPYELTDDDVVIRIWRPNPERRIEADSPFRSLIPVLDEIERLTLHIFAQIRSRLISAGILFMPEEMNFPPPPNNAPKNSNAAAGFMYTLAETMSAVMDDPDNMAANVPIVTTAPGDLLDKPRLMTFWSELDAASQEMRAGAVRRFAMGMDLPAEQVLGLSSNSGTGGGTSNGVSHWGAWQIDETTTKLHIEPMLELICTAVTVSYLRIATGDRSIVRYDTTSLRKRPDRSKEALELYDRGLIKGQVAVEENGFEASDMMDPAERTAWLTLKVATGSATPDQVAAALKALGVDVPEGTHDQPREARPTPSLEDHEQRTEPEMPTAASVLLAACEPLVYRGLERAGNRLRGAAKGAAPEGVPAFETHVYVKAKDPEYLLADAWSVADKVLDNSDTVVPVLDGYCRMLFSQQQPHTRAALEKWLERAS